MLTRLLQRGAGWVRDHQRALIVSSLSLLAGFGVTAFGLAPMAPDAATLPRRLITEPVAIESLDGQLEALAAAPLQLYRSDTTRSSDTVDLLLRRLGVADSAAADFLRSDPLARRLVEGRAGKMLQAAVDPQGRLLTLTARFAADGADGNLSTTEFQRLRIVRQGEQWHSTLERAPLRAGTRVASGTIESSLFAATDAAFIPDAVAIQMAEIFSADIDFNRELRKGDRFSVIFETLWADDEPVNWNQGSGRVLATEFINNGKTLQAVWFDEGKGGYFDFNGQSKRRAFLTSPLEFSRVTSGFAMRFHPVLKKWRAHLGVDYGAPTGTPVRSVGDGVVEFAGRQNGYGNVIEIRHGSRRSTVYAHLSRIDVRQGQRIDQGQRIGAVGATGWATGPHLHFEFHVDGQHHDPLEIAKASEAVTLQASQRARFAELAQRWRSTLDAAQTVAMAPARVE